MPIRKVVTLIAFLCLGVTTAVSAQSTNYGGTAATTGTTATYGQNTTSVPMSSASTATTRSTDGSHPRHRAMHKE
jgi:hypothetical protein